MSDAGVTNGVLEHAQQYLDTVGKSEVDMGVPQKAKSPPPAGEDFAVQLYSVLFSHVTSYAATMDFCSCFKWLSLSSSIAPADKELIASAAAFTQRQKKRYVLLNFVY